MTEPVISLIPVRAGDLAVGQPLALPVYDWHGKLLLASGAIVESQERLEELLETGFIQDGCWEAASGWQPAGEPAAEEASMKPGRAPESAPQPPAGDREVVAAMDEIRWRIGETLYLQLADNAGLRYPVRLIGFARNKTVFVSAPAVDGKFEFIRDGQLFIVRAFLGKKAYAFAATALKSVHTPHPYLLLSYPKEVRCTIVRQGVRTEVRIVASVSLGPSSHVAAALLTDLSMGGASGTLKQALGKKGDQGQIKFKVHAAGQDEYLNLKMALRSVVPAERGEGFKCGFEFLDVPIHDRLILSAFVHQTLAEGG